MQTIVPTNQEVSRKLIELGRIAREIIDSGYPKDVLVKAFAEAVDALEEE